MKKLILVIYAFSLTLNTIYAQDATYKIEFISNWSSGTHPTDYPSGAHWSALVGTTHNTNISFFEIGKPATNGIEKVAESGSNTAFINEINTSITNGDAYEVIEGDGLSSGPGTIRINTVNVDRNFPNISLISMIAPSPDWVAQINNLKLTDANDNWKMLLNIDVYATDTGTDNGVTYGSDDADTSPAENISSLENITPFSDQIIGTFKLTLLQVLAVPNNELKNAFAIYPNPSNGEIFIHNFKNNILLEKAEIFTIEGEKLRSFNQISNQNSLALHTLKSGLYFLRIATNKGSIIKKIILK